VRAVSNNPITALLVVFFACTAVALTVIGWELSFFLDDWTFMLYRRGSFDAAIMNPHGENVVIGLAIAYKALVNVFGMDAVAFRAALTILFLTSSALLFVYLRRRAGAFLALVATAMTLVLGAAYEDLLWAIQIGYFISLSCGLGALLLIDRSDRRGDPLACVLLTIGITSFSLGIPFVVGAAVAIYLGGADRWRRAWVVAVPVAVYGLWYLGWGHTAETQISATNIATAPLFLLDGFASSLSSLLGLATPSSQEAIGAMAWGRPLLAIAAAFAIWRLHKLGRIPDGLWVVLAMAAAFWLLAGINEKSGREPTVSRYQHIGAVFILMIAAELLAGVRLRRPVATIIALVAALAILSGGSYLWQARNSYLHTSQLEQAGLGAVELARDTVEPGFMLSPDLVDTGYVYVSAERYLSALDAYGHSPAFTEAEIATAPEAARVAADKTLGGALRITFTEGEGTAGPSCSEVAPGGAPVELAEGGAYVENPGGQPVDLKVGRYSDGLPLRPPSLAPGEAGELEIPADRGTAPWRLQVAAGAEPVRICSLADA
jgi:hypothetical protein